MPDEQRRDLIVDEWLKYAAGDELNAASILEHRDGNAAGVCFLAQQMAEKLLKALLIDQTGGYPKTHDLNRLVACIAPRIPSITNAVQSSVVMLDPYYIATRYVADIPIESYTWSNAEEALAAAKIIERFVLDQLGRKNSTS